MLSNGSNAPSPRCGTGRRRKRHTAKHGECAIGPVRGTGRTLIRLVRASLPGVLPPVQERLPCRCLPGGNPRSVPSGPPAARFAYPSVTSGTTDYRTEAPPPQALTRGRPPGPPAAMMRRPVAVEPVNVTASTSGDVVSTSPTEACEEEAAATIESLDRRVVAVEADVRDRGQLAAVLERGIAELGKLDVVVAQAGIAAMKGQPPLQAWTDCVDTLLLG